MNKIISLDELYTTDYEAKIMNSLKQSWIIKKSFSCLDLPKRDELFLYLHSCSGLYTLPDGTSLTAPRGSIVYTPVGSSYKVKFFETDSDIYNTIGVTFLLFDETGVPFSLSNNITVLDVSKYTRYSNMFFDLAQIYTQSVKSPSLIKAKFYSIIAEMCKFVRREKIRSTQFNVIEKGILYLEENYVHDLSIKKLAEMCNVSEIYFRRLFKEYAGVSPIQYKLNSKLELAKLYLASGTLSVNEISDLVGFSSTAYFCKIFKEKTGYTPKEYMRSLN